VLKDSSILITGGTGSFGRSFVQLTLKKYNPKRLVIYSRDEMKQWDMSKDYEGDNRVKCFLGDVRDLDRLERALDGVDYVVHAAATKFVPTAESDPIECIKTNIHGAINVIDACIKQRVKRVVALSTDKASAPANLYGATKMVSEKLFIAANKYSVRPNTIFSVVRYGNIMGSRGSIIPYFHSIRNKTKIPVTDPRMTRFMITPKQCVLLVWKTFSDMVGGEIYIKKIPSMKIMDVASTMLPDADHEIVGIRPGEKLHEQLIGKDDAPYTFAYDGYYKILPSIHNWSTDLERIKEGQKVSDEFIYESSSNDVWMTEQDLLKWIKNNRDIIGS
tara:strand:- start:1010 stop:2005 length:996 start_codon:yes stop_codon:yes gene_type:complete